MTRALFLGLVLGLFAATVLAEPAKPSKERPAADRGQSQDDDADDTQVLEYDFRLRGRFIDNLSDLGDITVQRLSIWSDFRIGDRVQARASYDVGETRIHDLYVQYDLGGGAPAGRQERPALDGRVHRRSLRLPDDQRRRTARR